MKKNAVPTNAARRFQNQGGDDLEQQNKELSFAFPSTSPDLTGGLLPEKALKFIREEKMISGVAFENKNT